MGIWCKERRNEIRFSSIDISTFDITYRAFQILKGYKNVPFVLANNIIINGASEKIKLLGDLGRLLRIEKNNFISSRV